jgi:DUF1009 family protein
MKIIGVIAGNGKLPQLIHEYCDKNQIKCYFVFINNKADFNLDNDKHIITQIGKVGKILKFFKKNKVTHILLAGGVKKPNFSTLKIDFHGLLLISKILKNKLLGDNILLSNVINFIEKYNFKVLATDDLLPNMHLKEGVNNNVKKYKNLDNDINIAVSLFKQISAFDIGQSLIIQNGRIIAIEAAEGTDQMLKRSKDYIEENKNHPAILVKISKKNQDRRADLPTVGIQTIENMYSSSIKILVTDVNNSLIIDKEKLFKIATEKKILIYGIIPDYE